MSKMKISQSRDQINLKEIANQLKVDPDLIASTLQDNGIQVFSKDSALTCSSKTLISFFLHNSPRGVPLIPLKALAKALNKTTYKIEKDLISKLELKVQKGLNNSNCINPTEVFEILSSPASNNINDDNIASTDEDLELFSDFHKNNAAEFASIYNGVILKTKADKEAGNLLPLTTATSMLAVALQGNELMCNGLIEVLKQNHMDNPKLVQEIESTVWSFLEKFKERLKDDISEAIRGIED